MEKSNSIIIKNVIKELEKLPDDQFAKVWNVYCSNSIGIADAKREKQYIKNREELHHKNGYDYSDAMFALAQDICIYYKKTYKPRVYNGKPLLDSLFGDLTIGFRDISSDEFLNFFISQI